MNIMHQEGNAMKRYPLNFGWKRKYVDDLPLTAAEARTLIYPMILLLPFPEKQMQSAGL